MENCYITRLIKDQPLSQEQNLRRTVIKTKILAAAIALIATSTANADSITVYGGDSYTSPGSTINQAFSFSNSSLNIIGFQNLPGYNSNWVLNSVDLFYSSSYSNTTYVTNESGTGAPYGAAQTYAYDVTTSASQSIYDPNGLVTTHTFSNFGSIASLAPYGGTGSVTGTDSYSGEAGLITTALATYNNNWNVTIAGNNPTSQINGGANYIAGPIASVTTNVHVAYNYTVASAVPEPASIALIAAGLAGFGFRRKAKAP
jgi:hypothetical protein